MNQNGGIHRAGFAVLCHRNGGLESPGILKKGDFRKHSYILIYKDEKRSMSESSYEFIGVECKIVKEFHKQEECSTSFITVNVVVINGTVF